MNDYTPPTVAVRSSYTIANSPPLGSTPKPELQAEFDRWLAEHDGQVKAEALREAANDWTQGAWADTPRRADRIADRMAASQYAGDWLRARAERTN